MFTLRGVSYTDGDTVLLSEIGEGENSLRCTTTQTDCCGQNADGMVAADERRGDFYYPNGTQVPTRGGAGGDGLFRGRDYQFISLQRLSTATTTPPTGRYRCDIPERNGVSRNMFINIGELNHLLTLCVHKRDYLRHTVHRIVKSNVQVYTLYSSKTFELETIHCMSFECSC